MNNFIYWLQYMLIVIFQKILLIFPERSRFRFAEWFAMLGYHLIKKRRIIALENLKLAFPDMPEAQRIEIAKRSYKIVAKSFLSSLWYHEYFDDPNNVKIVNKDLAISAYNKGKGVIGATMHMGNQDMTARAMHEYKFAAVAKRIKNPYLNRFITEDREKYLGIEIIQKNKYIARTLIELLKKGYIIGLLSDQRDKGTIIDFFGRTTKAPTGAISMALKFDVPVLFAYTLLNDDNTCTIIIQEELKLSKTGNFKEDVHTNTQMLIHKMEDVIRKYPEQWMWFHDRWDIYRTKYHKK